MKSIEQENKKNSPFSPQPWKQQLHPSSPLRHVDAYI